MLKDPPPVSAVIPNLNGGDMVVRAVRSIPARLAEVIVVDNASTDGSPDAVERVGEHVRVLRNGTNLGFAKACNQGAAVARGDYILVLNNDAALSDDALEVLLETAANEPQSAIWRPLIVTSTGELEFAGELHMRTGHLWRLHEPIADEPYSVFVAMGACLLVRRDVFASVGGFRESYFAYFEEADLCWRARLAGWEVRVVPGSRVVHLGGKTAGRVLTTDHVHYLLCRNRLRSTIANAGLLSLVWRIPIQIAGPLAIAVRFLATRRVRGAVSVLAGLAWPLAHPLTMFRERRSAQALRRMPDRRLFRPDLTAPMTRARAVQLLRGNISRWS